MSLLATRLRPQLGLYVGRSQPLTRSLPKRTYTQWKYQPQPRNMSWTLKAAGLAGVGVGLHAWGTAPVVHCDSRPVSPSPQPPPPESILNMYELTFGSVCGICAGVFIKKGAKAIAFLLGGAFVLLQYLGSASLVKVDWSKAATRFENLFYRTEDGVRKAPSVGSLYRWFLDFLTADFQQRASFIAGLVLGLRVG